MKNFDITHFNPTTLKEDDFLAGFIARQEILKFFINQLQATKQNQQAKHHLIIAPRGYGKTSLLRRIKIALRDDTQFKERYIPLSFREEQHNVISLDVFWRNCLQSLLEEREDEHADPEEIEILDQLWKENAPRTELKREDQDGEPGWLAFSEHCLKLKRRPVLLIDNLDALLIGLEKNQWNLRTILQMTDGPILIAAASKYPESLSDNNSAFFDFFRITTLPPLSDNEVMSCLRELAKKRGEKGAQVSHMLEMDPARISALNVMAGGNPRTLGVLYTVLEAHMSDDILAQLTAMLDTFTGWYQARTEELAMQSRAVFDALALNWNPMTAAEVSKVTGLDTPTVSSQLSRLEKSAHIEAVPLSKKKKGRNGYQVSERFFNIWYLMRNGPRRTQQAIRFLTVFLQSCFSRKELRKMAKDKLIIGSGRIESTLALADSISDSRLRKRLLDTAENYLEQHDRAFDLKNLVKEMRQKSKSNDKANSKPENNSITILLKDAFNNIEINEFEKAEAIFQLALSQDKNDYRVWHGLGRLFHYHLNRYEEAEAAYRKAISLDDKIASIWGRLGDLLLRDSNRQEEAEAAYRQAIKLDEKWAIPWDALGDLLTENERYEEAEAAYRQAIKLDEEWATPWLDLGNLLQYQLKHHEEAETAYRRAIELDEKWATPWGALGDLLVLESRYSESEAAYRKAISLNDQKFELWAALGDLLQYGLNRYEDAEVTYRQGIKLNKDSALLWNAFGDFLTHTQKNKEAELAYRKAIELDEKWATPWNGLGNLLQHNLNRYEESEAAYRKAIALDKNWATPWDNLGDLFSFHLERYESAEDAYKQAIAIDGSFSTPWVGLGNLLQYYFERYEEAEFAYQQAIKLNEKWAAPWHGLGNLLHHNSKRYEEAEAAYRNAIALDKEWGAPWSSLGKLLETHYNHYEEAEAAYRQAIKLDKKLIAPWVRLGNLLQDYLGRYTEALETYELGYEIFPNETCFPANSTYLLALHMNKPDKAVTKANQAKSNMSVAGVELMNAALAWSDGAADEAGRGWHFLNKAITSKDELLWTAYIDDLQRILAFAIARGDGQLINKWMQEQNYPSIYAPLYHAFIAAIKEEDYLLTINPEVRVIAEDIYKGITTMLPLYNKK